MKKGFYMGYDAATANEGQLKRQARYLLDTGLFGAGYRVLRLGDIGRFEKIGALAASLRALGFQLDVTVKGDVRPQQAAEMLETVGAGMVTLAPGENREGAMELAKALAGRARIAVAVKDDMAWAAPLADVVDLDCIREDDDFFEITRNRLDSCRDGDTDAARSAANLRAQMMGEGGAWHAGNLPLRFDAFRNEAIFAQFCMLGCPLVLSGDIGALPGATLSLLRNEALIDLARRGQGRVARYYDPWHVLLVKQAGEGSAFAMILNRCHGDQPTNLLPGDMGWEGRFSLRQLPEYKLVGANLEAFEAHLETSDHPETPCCGVYYAERIGG